MTVRSVRRVRSCVVLGAALLLVAAACAPMPGSNRPPVAVIAATPDAGDPPLEVSFSGASSTDLGGSIVSYVWDFGDGATATGVSATHIYATKGVYTARLTVRDNEGASGTATKLIQVGPPNQAPVAVASVSPGSGKVGQSFGFSASGSADVDGTIVAYVWDFGDGATGSGESPSHVYTAAGLYAATLTVTDDSGAVASDTTTVVVSANQGPTAVAAATSSPVGKEPLTVALSGAGSSDPDGGVVSYAWDFGDGTTGSGATTSHTYATFGSYSAVLTVADAEGLTSTSAVNITVNKNQGPTAVANATPAAGQAPLIVSFSSAGSADPDGSISSYAWTFGDGNGSNVANPSYTYGTAGTYPVTLTVTDDNGVSSSSSLTVEVSPVPNVAPTAVVGAAPTSGKQNLTVSFTSSNSTDPDGVITSRSWNFGDGTGSSDPNPTKTYTTAGNFTATLTVTDNAGAVSTASVAITVTPNQPPTAAISGGPLTGKAPLSASFSGSGSSDPDGLPLTYAWDFGNGQTATTRDASASYSQPGTYTVQLVVTDDAGATSTATRTVTVVANQAPTAVANASVQNGPRPLVVNFNSSASTDPDGTVASYAWNFGDGTSSTAANPSKTYNDAGTFTASLVVTDDNGTASAAASVVITVVIDDDGDGVSPPTDCNDADPLTKPGAADALDAAGKDTNCDGYDGVLTQTVFVRGADGVDDASCGTPAAPCATIAQGQSRAVAQSRTTVLVAGGSYSRFTLTGGLTVAGGYGQNFQRGTAATGTVTTTVNGSLDTSLDASVAVVASGITATTELRDLTIAGAAAPAGKASYGMVVLNSTSALTLRNLAVTAGAGGAGSAGASGTSATQTAAASGNRGENSEEVGSLVCAGRYDARKAGGASVSGSGAGGQGGQQDTGCFNYNATAGLGGGNASLTGAGCGTGGSGGAAAGSGNAGSGSAGAPGCVTNGTGGSAGSATNGTIGTNGLWSSSGGTGGNGTVGSNGGAGGGGGGGGGSDETNDDMGAGGGSGGVGGAAAPAAGTGGSTGAASIGVLLSSSNPGLVSVSVTLGTGGAGGAGGTGGLGQPGGAGGAGGQGLCNNSTSYSGYPFGTCSTGGNGGAGGAGGAGGRGGNSGGGGGGAGGPSFGVVLRSSTSSLAGVTYSGGTGGAGGAGGSTGVGGATGQAGPRTNSVTL